MHISTYSQALDYIYSLTMSGTQRIFGHLGLERTKYLLSLVDNPQDKLKIIHVAGTSGKGGTCYILSELLQKVAKKSIGLHVSPHLLDLRERIQINGQLIDEQSFVDALNILIPAVQSLSDSFFGLPSYYEVTTALMYLCFARAGVDFAIVEVGCGGLLDGTNITDNPKYCVITKQGFDHMEIVGHTMTEITRNDAGIITPDSTVITLHHEESICNDIIAYRCQTRHAHQIIFDPQTHLHNIRYNTDQTCFDYQNNSSKIAISHLQLSTSLLGPFHLENLGLALTAFLTICDQDLLPLEKGGWGDLLNHLHRKGRFDFISYQDKKLLLDGAHNPQKMQALVDTLTLIYPDTKTSGRWSFYLSFKQGKQRQEMLDIIIPHASEIIIGDFMTIQDFKLHSVPVSEIIDYLQSHNYHRVRAETDVLRAISSYDHDHPLIITGSLYFLSAVYGVIEKN